jgi:hypothetical protein
MQTNISPLLILGVTSYYNCNVYGGGGYGEGTKTICSTDSADSGSGAGGSHAGGTLADTGVSIFIPLILGVVLIAAAVTLFLSTKRRGKKR